MHRSSEPESTNVSPAEIWGYLSLERRVQIIQFMAQLAFNLLKVQIDLSVKEVTDVNRSNAQQNSSRPS